MRLRVVILWRLHCTLNDRSNVMLMLSLPGMVQSYIQRSSHVSTSTSVSSIRHEGGIPRARPEVMRERLQSDAYVFCWVRRFATLPVVQCISYEWV